MSDELDIRKGAAPSSKSAPIPEENAGGEATGAREPQSERLRDEDAEALLDEVAEAVAAAELRAERLRMAAGLDEEAKAIAAELRAEEEALLAEEASLLAKAGDAAFGDEAPLDEDVGLEAEAADDAAASWPDEDASGADPATGAASLAAEDASLGAEAGDDTAIEEAADPKTAEDQAREQAAAEEMARELSEETTTAEEELLAQAREDADPDASVAPAEIEEVDEEAAGSFEKFAAKARRLTEDQARNILHSLLFVADKPLSVEQLRNTTGLEASRIREGLERLAGELREGISGVVLSEVGGGWQLRTAPESADYIRRFLQIKPRRLTRAALETLAIVAYRQPVTRPEIEEIRGVDCGAVVKALLEWKLIKILGKKDEAGRPLLYGTTKEFLEFFQLRDLASLPSLREFHELNEESRQIVEEELGTEAVGEIAGTLAELADPEYLEAEKNRVAKSESALADLEQAMADAEQVATTVTESLSPSKEKAEGEDVEAEG